MHYGGSFQPGWWWTIRKTIHLSWKIPQNTNTLLFVPKTHFFSRWPLWRLVLMSGLRILTESNTCPKMDSVPEHIYYIVSILCIGISSNILKPKFREIPVKSFFFNQNPSKKRLDWPQMEFLDMDRIRFNWFKDIERS